VRQAVRHLCDNLHSGKSYQGEQPGWWPNEAQNTTLQAALYGQ